MNNYGEMIKTAINEEKRELWNLAKHNLKLGSIGGEYITGEEYSKLAIVMINDEVIKITTKEGNTLLEITPDSELLIIFRDLLDVNI